MKGVRGKYIPKYDDRVCNRAELDFGAIEPGALLAP